MWRLVLVSACLLTVVSLGACNGEETPGCGDCPSKESCGTDDECHPVCDAGSPCDTGFVCGDGLCYAVVCGSPQECQDADVCNGAEICNSDGTCGLGTPAALGTVCDADGDVATFDICREGVCATSVCDDDWLDTRAAEVCDDGNTLDGDGCNADCLGTCELPSECEDGNVCTQNSCTNLECDFPAVAPGTICDFAATDDGICTNGACVAASCLGAGDCDDSDDCTVDTCSLLRDCEYANLTPTSYYIDCDGDGFAAAAAGATTSCLLGGPVAGPGCARGTVDVWTDVEPADASTTDCNDDDDQIIEETDWYADCDDDGFAAYGAFVSATCDPLGPATSPVYCGGGAWTTLEATALNSTDCDDDDPTTMPGGIEVCDGGTDNDCDGDADDTDADVTGQSIWYVDCDGDTFAASGVGSTVTCVVSGPAGSAGCAGGTSDAWTAIAPTSPGTTDCDDTDAAANPSRTWYADCDSDGYARNGAPTTLSCAPPIAAPSACGSGQWTEFAPTGLNVDCDDTESDAFPGQTTYSTASYGGTWDWNCDGVVSLRWTAVPPSPPLLYTCSGPFPVCAGVPHWTTTTAPSCGTSATMNVCGTGTACAWSQSATTQECR